MPQKMAGVKARPQKFQVQVQTTVLRQTFDTTTERKHSSYFKILSVPQAIHCQWQDNW